jgi:RNA polymerase sigma-70 factor (ECF subfamily)
MKKEHLKIVSEPEKSHENLLSDDELMLLCKRNNRKAFRTLVERYQDMVLGYAYRYLADRDAAEEVGQEVFLALWSERMRYQAQGKFRSFLLTMSINRCRVYARSRTRHLRKIKKLKSAMSPEMISVDSSPMDDLLRAAQIDEVQKRLAQLPSAMKQAIILRYYNGLSIKEIAKLLGSPEGSVKSNLFRGIKKLGGAL